MSITAECTSCGRKYQAPDNMAGKRVRCKQCGNIFSLPTNSDELSSDLDALTQLEKSFHSVDGTDAGTPPPDEDQSDDDESSEVAPLRRGRTNVRFSFPFAREVDRWLPTVLTVLGLLWLVAECVSFNEPEAPKWMPYVRAAAGLIAYFVFVGPITLAMIRQAGRKTGYQMPSNDRARAFATYLPAFVLGCVMWAAGGGQPISLFLGGFVGIALFSTVLWLLFRLQPNEIAPSAIYASIGFFLGLGIVSALYYGLNLLLIQVLVSLKSPDVIPASPFGPNLAWITPEQKAQIAEDKKKAPVVARNDTPPSATHNPTPAPPPAQVASDISAIVRTVENAPIKTPFDQIIYPLTESPFRALSRVNGGNTIIDLWDSGNWTQKGLAGFNTAGPNEPGGNRYVLSPDGKLLARISNFPRLSAQIWSFADQMNLPVVSLKEELGAPELVGFVDPQHLLIRWQRDVNSPVVFQVIELSAAEIGRVQTPAYEQKGTTLAVSQNGKLAAITTKVDNKPTLLICNFENGKQFSTPITSLDPRWPVTPTGMAFSFDSQKLAILFEQTGNGLLLAYRIDLDKGQATQIAEHVYPAGAMPQHDPSYIGSGLDWLPDGKTCLLYGQGLIDIASGRKLEELRVNGVLTSHVSSPNLVELSVRSAATAPRQIELLRLDIDKIASLQK